MLFEDSFSPLESGQMPSMMKFGYSIRDIGASVVIYSTRFAWRILYMHLDLIPDMFQVMKADWDEIILDPVFKKALRTDVNGFFSSEDIYKKLKIPWKVRFVPYITLVHSLTPAQRGLIMHGPPGGLLPLRLNTL